jgi:hypothetical protein
MYLTNTMEMKMSCFKPDFTLSGSGESAFVVLPAPGHCGDVVRIISIHRTLEAALRACRKRKDRCVSKANVGGEWGYIKGSNVGPWVNIRVYWNSDGSRVR